MIIPLSLIGLLAIVSVVLLASPYPFLAPGAVIGLAGATRTVTCRALCIGHRIAERGRTAALARQHQLQGAGVLFIAHDGRRCKRGRAPYRETSL